MKEGVERMKHFFFFFVASIRHSLNSRKFLLREKENFPAWWVLVHFPSHQFMGMETSLLWLLWKKGLQIYLPSLLCTLRIRCLTISFVVCIWDGQILNFTCERGCLGFELRTKKEVYSLSLRQSAASCWFIQTRPRFIFIFLLYWLSFGPLEKGKKKLFLFFVRKGILSFPVSWNLPLISQCGA